jgi:CRISPR-associated endoribonuclease Cas6
MYRIRLSLPRGQEAIYRHLDLLHDALVEAWSAAGASSEAVVGRQARPWNFAALGGHRGSGNLLHTLIVSTPDRELATHLKRFDPARVRYGRAHTAEAVDFARATILPDPDPVAPGQTALGVVMLSPLAISREARKDSGHRWHNNVDDFDLSAAVNKRLSRMAGRTTAVTLHPDRLYLRIQLRHDTLVPIKQTRDGKTAFVIGMLLPLVLQGPEEDLRFAWYAGIGEKNRNGFGAIGIAEKGIGR